MGSAACYYLASKGCRVLGLEQFDIVHDKGSHTGQSRIIRKAYFEHPHYVPILEKAYRNWQQIESLTGQQLFYKTGVLYMGEKNNPVMEGVTRSALLYNISIEHLDSVQLKERFAQFSLPASYEGIFEPDAGFVLPEKTIQQFTALAMSNGAVIRSSEAVAKWSKEGKIISIKTASNVYLTEKLIFTSGAWTGELIPVVQPKLTVTHQVLAWVKPRMKDHFLYGRFPCWFINDNNEAGSFYGFPDLSQTILEGPDGLKLARHFPGPVTKPGDSNKNSDEEEIIKIKAFLSAYMPNAGTNICAIRNCLYTNSPDQDFIIDFVPGYDKQVIVATGFSGHGFKFVPAIGEILADLVMEGKTELALDFLQLARFK